MSAIDVLHIWNLALSEVGNSVEVQAEDENSAEANACRRFYAQVRDELLEAFPWPFAKVTVPLVVVETQPTTEWAFAYRYPVDCLTFRRIIGVARNETRQTRVPYLIGRDSTGQLIYTDWTNAIGEYTLALEDTTQFAPSFAKALAYKLASDIAPRVAGGDPYKLGQIAWQKFTRQIEIAQSNALNEEQVEEAPDAEFIRAREGGLSPYPPPISLLGT
jgi:hypothetical protein